VDTTYKLRLRILLPAICWNGYCRRILAPRRHLLPNKRVLFCCLYMHVTAGDHRCMPTARRGVAVLCYNAALSNRCIGYRHSRYILRHAHCFKKQHLHRLRVTLDVLLQRDVECRPAFTSSVRVGPLHWVELTNALLDGTGVKAGWQTGWPPGGAWSGAEHQRAGRMTSSGMVPFGWTAWR